MILYKGRGRAIYIFKIVIFLVPQSGNIFLKSEKTNCTLDAADIYVEHNTHPGSQYAPYKKSIATETRD